MRKNSEFTYDLIDLIEEPVLFLSADFKIVEANTSVENILNIKIPDLIGKPFTTICPSFKDFNDKNYSNILTPHSGQRTIVWQCLHSNLSQKNIKFIIFGNIKEPSNDINSLHEDIKNLNQSLIGQDIRQDKHTIEHVKDIYQYMENIIAEIPVSVYWMNTHCIYLGCSNSMASLLKLKSRQDIIGKTYTDLYDQRSSEHYQKADKAVMETGVSLSLEEPLYSEDGSKKVYLSNKVPLRDTHGKIIGMLGISVDITDRKKMEEDLKQAKEAAETSSTAKTEFIANMSHDIRTPLAGVIGLGSILEKEIENPTQKTHIHDIVKSADELLNMLNEIIEVVTLGKITTECNEQVPFDLGHLIQTIIDLEQSSVDLKKIEFRKHIDEKIPAILLGDHKKIHHILLNLVSNAIKFTKKGHVNIDIKLSEILNDKVRILFEISDSGIGIPPESLDKIFELFYKVTPSYKCLDKGHGVGLHIVKTYTELLGGKISVESNLNQGSKFSLILTLQTADRGTEPKNIHAAPLIEHSEEPSQLISTKVKTTPSVHLNAPEILIIEDNVVALKIAEALVSQAQCNPTPAPDGETALELAKSKHFDLILSDIGLPGISGIEFAQQFRQYETLANKKAVPIVAITGHAEGKMHDECIAAGINEVFIKPIRPEMLSEIGAKFDLFGNTTKQPSPSNVSDHPPPATSTEKSNMGGLGLDLPNTEDELFAIDNQIIFDIETAQKILGDNTVLLMKMLRETINIIIPAELPRLKTAYEASNWQVVADISHKLKGGFLSIGLNQAATACKYLERYYKTGETKLLEKLYQQVLKTLDATSTRLQLFVK